MKRPVATHNLLLLATVAVFALASLFSAASASAASAPLIESESVSHIAATDATLEAKVNPNGPDTTYRFEIARSPACLPVPAPYMPCAHVEAGNLPSGSVPSGSEGQPVSLDLASAGMSLEPGATYHYRVVASNSSGEAEGQAQTFTTTFKPSIESESVSSVTATDATIEAQINPGGLETIYHFRLAYGCGIGEACPMYCIPGGPCPTMHPTEIPLRMQALPASSEPEKVILNLNDAGVTLEPGTKYLYSVEATNAEGNAEGLPQFFTTPSTSAPVIEGESISRLTQTDATLEAQINTEGLETSYQFRLESGCLPPLACLAITVYPLPSGKLLGSFIGQSVSLDLNSAGVTLHPGTKYRYSVDASNSAGTAEGPAQTFTTPSEPGPIPLGVPSLGGTALPSSVSHPLTATSSVSRRKHHRRHKRGLHGNNLHRASRTG